MSISTSVILDNRRIKKDGKYPVKLRVIYNRAVKDYSTVFNLSEADYKKLSAPRVSNELSEIRGKLNEISATSNSVIQQLKPFSFGEFEIEYIKTYDGFFKNRKQNATKSSEKKDADDFDYSPFLKRFSIFKEEHPGCNYISVFFLSYIKQLLQQGRIGSAINYQRTYRSLKLFKGNVTFEQITVSYLFQYERWMLDKGTTKTTVGIVLRPLRSIFNEAIESGIIKREKCYPFGRRKYQIPASRNVKKALTQAELKSIFYFKPDNERVATGKDYWLFCYLANGMNVKDMVYLRWKNIQDEYLIFERAKTERANRTDPRPITVYLTEELNDIIQRNANNKKMPDDFIFPIMQPGLNHLEQFDLLNHIRRMINDAMEAIAIELGISKKITTIVSRHSFSTQLKRSGVSTEFIQEALGHTNKQTTENYLDSFEKEVKKEFAKKLTSFKEDFEEMQLA